MRPRSSPRRVRVRVLVSVGPIGDALALFGRRLRGLCRRLLRRFCRRLRLGRPLFGPVHALDGLFGDRLGVDGRSIPLGRRVLVRGDDRLDLVGCRFDVLGRRFQILGGLRDVRRGRLQFGRRLRDLLGPALVRASKHDGLDYAGEDEQGQGHCAGGAERAGDGRAHGDNLADHQGVRDRQQGGHDDDGQHELPVERGRRAEEEALEPGSQARQRSGRHARTHIPSPEKGSPTGAGTVTLSTHRHADSAMVADFEVIPAVDMQDGRVVQLVGGERGTGRTYGEPVAAAERWVEAGAETLHLVDLDGAFEGQRENADAIDAILAAVDVPVQLGGGIRTVPDALDLLERGVERVILGTAAVERPAIVEEISGVHANSVVVSLDAKDGEVVVSGWTEGTGLDPAEAAGRYADLGAAAILFTDVDVEGQLAGVRTDQVRRVVEAVDVPVIASGGVATLDDVRALRDAGAAAVVVGSALYEGEFTLAEAQAAVDD